MLCCWLCKTEEPRLVLLSRFFRLFLLLLFLLNVDPFFKRIKSNGRNIKIKIKEEEIEQGQAKNG